MWLSWTPGVARRRPVEGRVGWVEGWAGWEVNEQKVRALTGRVWRRVGEEGDEEEEEEEEEEG
jgi:hypothetical protein